MFIVIVYTMLLTNIRKANCKRMSILKTDLRLKSIIYSIINIASISNVSINSAFIIKMSFLNGTEARRVR